jgi:Zn-dependent membrane protease YugP
MADIPVETVKGKLTDHYDPSKRVLRLSPEVQERPLAAVGIALHESAMYAA